MLDIRNARISDADFITATWLRNYRNAPFVKDIPNKAYFYYQHKLIEALFDRCDEKKVVYDGSRVVDTEDGTFLATGDTQFIKAWIVADATTEGLIVHYIYVRPEFRRQGLATELINYLLDKYDLSAVFYTHKSPMMVMRNLGLSQKARDRGYIYHPYLAFTTIAHGWEASGS